MRSHFLLFAATGLTLTLAGCQNQQPPTTQPSDQAGQLTQPAAEKPDESAQSQTDSSVPDDLELLVRKAESHAQRVTNEMERSGTLEEAAKHPPSPSVNDWMQPQAYQMGQSQSAPTTAPSSEVSPAAADSADTAEQTSTANTPISIDDKPATKPQTVVRVPPRAGQQAAAEPNFDQQIDKKSMDYPKDLAAQLDYQLLQFIANKPAPDLARLAALADEDQEIITAVIDGLTNFRNAISIDPNLLLSRKVKPLIDAGERLRSRADLELPIVELCRRVDGYGAYEPVEHQFVSGQERDVIIYCEVENFMSQYLDNNQWQTKLSEEVVIYTDSDGLPILRDKPTIVTDLCRNRRHDFFIVRKLRLPGNIPVGRYWLKVTVVDQQANRVAEHSIPIIFVAK